MLLDNLPEETRALPAAVRMALLEAAAPSIVILCGVLAVFASYGVRRLLVGPYHDDEMDERGLGGLTSRGMRHVFAWFMRPIWRVLAAASVPPNAITTLGLVLALMAGLAAASGHFVLAGWLFIAGGALDFLDGRIARATGEATGSGAALDSVVDRYSEAALLSGLCWYYGGTKFLAIAVRAIGALAVLAVLSHVTAAQRLVHLFQALEARSVRSARMRWLGVSSLEPPSPLASSFRPSTPSLHRTFSSPPRRPASRA